jgi:hypothetical protein
MMERMSPPHIRLALIIHFSKISERVDADFHGGASWIKAGIRA